MPLQYLFLDRHPKGLSRTEKSGLGAISGVRFGDAISKLIKSTAIVAGDFVV